MKKVNVKEKVRLIGETGFADGKRVITYYLVLPNHDKKYAFRQTYSETTYNLCKSGIRVNELLVVKSKNTKVMQLVGRTKRMIPYLAEYYDIAMIG